MLRILLITLIFYFLYRIILDFLIPVFKMGKQLRVHMHRMGETMESTEYKQQTSFRSAEPSKRTNRPTQDEYLDFEEIK